MAPKTKTVELPTLCFRSVSKLPREKRNECDIGVQYVLSNLQAWVNGGSSYDSTLQARVNSGSSYDSTLQARVNSGSSYDSLNGKHHTLRRYLDL